VGLDRGAAGGRTGIELAMPTKVGGRGAAVPAGVDLTRGGVADGSTVGEAIAVGCTGALDDVASATMAPTTSNTATAPAPMRTRGSSARSRASAASI
jgi:hypothetical protein